MPCDQWSTQSLPNMQKPHQRASTWHYYPYSGGKRLSPKSLGVPLAEPVEKAFAAMRARGDGAPGAAVKRKTLLAAVDDYEAYRRDRNKGARLRYTAARVRRVVTDCGFRTAEQMTPDVVLRCVAQWKGPEGVSTATANQYLAECQAFCRWLVRNKRAADNPLTALDYFPADGDVRRNRRAFTADEQAAVFAAARASGRKKYRLMGMDRYMLYRLAACTGLRAYALAMLTPIALDLDADPATVVSAATDQKNKTLHRVPLASSFAAELRDYLAGRDPATRIWPGMWYGFAARMLRVDLAAAGVPTRTEDGNAHFHSFRHTFTSRVARVATTKVGMSLTGHKTASVFHAYTHVDEADRNAVIGALDGAPQPAPAASLESLITQLESRRLAHDMLLFGDCWLQGTELIPFGELRVIGQIHQLDEREAVNQPTHSASDANHIAATLCTSGHCPSNAL
jgi:integrase